MSTNNAVEPLQDLLGSIMSRLEALESAAGIEGGSSVTTTSATAAVTEDSPAVKAYDEHFKKDIIPLVSACADIGDGKFEVVGSHFKSAWECVRLIVVAASKSKAPTKDIPAALMPHLKPVQTALESIRKLRLDRKWDMHIKSVLELVTALSWILIKPPPQTPVTFIKEAIASSTFWSNKIRKEFKGKDDKQIHFCNCLKAIGTGLVDYVTKHHITGLTFNPRGISFEEAAAECSVAKKEESSTSKKKSGGGGGVGSLMSELQGKQTADKASAATGLRKVTRDKQTWRKEYKGEKSSAVPAVKTTTKTMTPTAAKPKKVLPPICEYQNRGNKWVIEHQTKKEGPTITIEIKDPKHQVYAFDCEDITIQVKGDKSKSIVLDKCRRVNVVFNSCISSCEIVNSSKIQCQTTGLCPTFSIDKTVGCLVYLSEESAKNTSFVTSQSSEMNVSYPTKDGTQKELPIPEQFMHKISDDANGGLTSEVSELYH